MYFQPDYGGLVAREDLLPMDVRMPAPKVTKRTGFQFAADTRPKPNFTGIGDDDVAPTGAVAAFKFAKSTSPADFGGLDGDPPSTAAAASFDFAKTTSTVDYGGLDNDEAASGDFQKSVSLPFRKGDKVRLKVGGNWIQAILDAIESAGTRLLIDASWPGGSIQGLRDRGEILPA